MLRPANFNQPSFNVDTHDTGQNPRQLQLLETIGYQVNFFLAGSLLFCISIGYTSLIVAAKMEVRI